MGAIYRGRGSARQEQNSNSDQCKHLSSSGFFGTLGAAISGLILFRSEMRSWQRNVGRGQGLIFKAKLVGAGRFELPTPGPPDRCANRAALRSDVGNQALCRDGGKHKPGIDDQMTTASVFYLGIKVCTLERYHAPQRGNGPVLLPLACAPIELP
jgi:hypothetical protein